ncbi:LysR family transcriptional regulator [Curvibacter sp. RS43]|uniref:LysR family transcriptional regulator n=1 Tax=Curvibacter microcysteis TaxID=3026419 RepID=UPI002360EEA3|nr:LysR family transcriptional regulator [Curvibacter sp. RS43]MDD0812844.1 LysR family transcriptional regulator [Curvibacter sp. RS43]
MHLNRLDLNLVVALDHLLAERSVTRAAVLMSISQPAMSGALTRLREHFDDALLHRAGRDMALTPFAASLAPRVHDLVVQMGELVRSRPHFDPATSDRAFTVVGSDYAHSVLLPLVAQQVTKLAPRVTLHHEGRSNDHEARFVRGLIDAFVVPRTMMLPNHPAMDLFNDHYVLVACASNTAINEQVSLQQYIGMRHAIRKTAGDSGGVTREELRLMELGLERDIALTVPTFELLAKVVVGTPLVAGMQRRLAEVAALSLPIKILPHPVDISPLELVLQWPAARENDAGLTWLKDVFRTAVKNDI